MKYRKGYEALSVRDLAVLMTMNLAIDRSHDGQDTTGTILPETLTLSFSAGLVKVTLVESNYQIKPALRSQNWKERLLNIWAGRIHR